MITSRIKVGHPERVFRYGDDDEKKMQVQFAPLCVLHDDLTLFARQSAGAKAPLNEYARAVGPQRTDDGHRAPAGPLWTTLASGVISKTKTRAVKRFE
jgi:hypothetical protein